LKRHVLIHTGENKKYACPVCSKDFGRKSHLDRHIKTHNSPRCHKCAICKKKYSRKYYFQAHKRIHDEEDDVLTTDDEEKEEELVVKRENCE
jgi:uncharacterized Zn-finger protein